MSIRTNRDLNVEAILSVTGVRRWLSVGVSYLASSSRSSARVPCLCDLHPAIDHLLDASRDLRNVRGIETTATEPVSEPKIINILGNENADAIDILPVDCR